ncbi:hypothetical protein OAM75_03345, partial [Gammaproteobacteria bacterium]|nr:hypothetical protein [Gammaproteobacteria bacterium]MDC0413982.1 hypothetical protein [Gammaproteobacteria bacterium]
RTDADTAKIEIKVTIAFVIFISHLTRLLESDISVISNNLKPNNTSVLNLKRYVTVQLRLRT